MSPVAACLGSLTARFPRVSGDEPWIDLNELPLDEFSPRERG